MRDSQMNGRWKPVEEHINSVQDTDDHFVRIETVSGGCINQTWKITDSDNKCWFIKENKPSLLKMFVAEAEGLKEIRNSNSIKTPNPVCFGKTDNFSYLVLEYISMRGGINQHTTGEQLASMHQKTHSLFGWDQENTIGSTPQLNTQHADWPTFWKEQRLLFQLELAHTKGYPDSDYEAGLKLSENLKTFFSNYQPVPSLLHGDLWGGNCSTDSDNNPVIFDPALYYGDREADIAMTELFGGFSQQFYLAYNDSYQLDPGYKTRKTLYNLYHILNHYNLFGGGYASQAATMSKQLLSEIN